jgi:hypothetical protein
MLTAAMLCVAENVADRVWVAVPQPTEMAAHRKSDRRCDGLCAGALRKDASFVVHADEKLTTLRRGEKSASGTPKGNRS